MKSHGYIALYVISLMAIASPLSFGAQLPMMKGHIDAGHGTQMEVFTGVATSAYQSFSTAQAATSGDWSNAGSFIYSEFTLPKTAHGYPNTYARYAMAGDDFWTPTDDSRSADDRGRLCTITTGSVGELNLHLYMSYTDEQNMLDVQLEGRAVFQVQ